MSSRELAACMQLGLEPAQAGAAVEVSCQDHIQQLEDEDNEEEEDGRIAPRRDPMALMRLLLAQPPLAEAATITGEQLADMARQTAMQASMVVAQIDHGVFAPEDIENQIGRIFHRFLHMVASVMRAGRMEVIAHINTCNLEQLRPDPEAVAAARPRLAQLPPLLGLSELQLQDISAGIELFDELLRSNKQQQQEVQAELMSSSSTAAISSANGAQSFCALAQDMEAWTQQVERMQLLLHKEYTLRVAVSAWFMGNLSWTQYARATMLAWPYHVRFTLLAQDIAQYYNEQQAAAAKQARSGKTGAAQQQQQPQQQQGGHKRRQYRRAAAC